MSKEGTEKFINRLEQLIDTSRKCHEITYIELIGSLETVKLDIYTEMFGEDEDEDV